MTACSGMCDDELGGLRKAFFFFFLITRGNPAQIGNLNVINRINGLEGGVDIQPPTCLSAPARGSWSPPGKCPRAAAHVLGPQATHLRPTHTFLLTRVGRSVSSMPVLDKSYLIRRPPGLGRSRHHPETGRPRFALAPSGAAPTRHGTCPACASFQMREVQGHGRPPVADIVLETGCWVLTLDMQ